MSKYAEISEWLISRLRVQGFRSLQDITLELAPVTILVGPNGAGKSSLVSALTFFRDALLQSPEMALRQRGGMERLLTNLGTTASSRPAAQADSLSLEVEVASRAPGLFRGVYFVRFKPQANGWQIAREIAETWTGVSHDHLIFEVEQGKWLKSVSGLEPRLAPDRLALPLLSGAAGFLPLYNALTTVRRYDVNPQSMGALHEPDQQIILETDGGNAASVLLHLQKEDPQRFERVLQTLGRVIGSIQKVTPKTIGRALTIAFEETLTGKRSASFDAEQMSEGALRTLGILLAAYTLDPSALILLEEPERAIHPGAAAALAEALQEAGLRTQIVATTHSPDLISHFDLESLRAVKREKGLTQVGPVKPAQLESIRQNLFTAGEIHRFEGLTPE